MLDEESSPSVHDDWDNEPTEKTKITAHEKKEINTEVKSKDQEDNDDERAQKEATPNTEDSIEDKN